MHSSSQTYEIEMDPRFLAQADATPDLRTYLGSNAHKGQTFSVDTALKSLGKGRFTEVSASRIAFTLDEVSLPGIGSGKNVPLSLDLIGDGRGTLRIGGTSFEATCKVVRYWLEVSFFHGTWHTVSLWRDGVYSMFQYTLLRAWLTPTGNQLRASTELPNLTRGPAAD